MQIGWGNESNGINPNKTIHSRVIKKLNQVGFIHNR